ncbi:jg19345 [Pararge aegeria aegeria]|uniref:Jg19345 protein n=1 Tax=Pararge aegeria aegeria TaxID=348720 RepID=A0A8S4QE10_9NEOP|nr:jg19345 [Pararge aegeria aegeria]
MVIILFGGAMVGFFCRSPQIFHGWGDVINDYFELNDPKFVRDSALAALVAFMMFLLPSNLSFCKNLKAKFHEEFPRERVRSVLDWKSLIGSMPYSFTFLLGGGFALSEAAKKTGFNEKIGETLQHLKSLPNVLIMLIVIIFVILITNVASNVAVCNVLTPICMTLVSHLLYHDDDHDPGSYHARGSLAISKFSLAWSDKRLRL